MGSIVAGQGSEGDILAQAIALELDCIAAYQTAAERLGEASLRMQMAAFVQQHQERQQRLQQRLQDCQLPAGGPNAVTVGLNRAKVQLTSWISDRAILQAVHNNALDSHQAYVDVAQRVELASVSRSLFAELAEDARRQLDWFAEQGLPAK